MEKFRYQVSVRVEIRKAYENGGWTNDSMSFENREDLGELNLAQVAELLMRFHELSKQAITKE